jgi:hypothetical protein
MNEWQSKEKFYEETCLSSSLSTTGPTRLELAWNSGFRGKEPAINPLSYRTPSRYTNITR